MSSARKLWETRRPIRRRHSSQKAAYRHLRDLAWTRRNSESSRLLQFVEVWVDERDGRGFQLYERVDLEQLGDDPQ